MAKQRPGRCRVYGGGVLNVSALAVAGPANQSAQATPALQGFEHDRGEVDALLPACCEDGVDPVFRVLDVESSYLEEYSTWQNDLTIHKNSENVRFG